VRRTMYETWQAQDMVEPSNMTNVSSNIPVNSEVVAQLSGVAAAVESLRAHIHRLAVEIPSIGDEKQGRVERLEDIDNLLREHGRSQETIVGGTCCRKDQDGSAAYWDISQSAFGYGRLAHLTNPSWNPACYSNFYSESALYSPLP
jgi:hypothetical protein